MIFSSDIYVDDTEITLLNTKREQIDGREEVDFLVQVTCD